MDPDCTISCQSSHDLQQVRGDAWELGGEFRFIEKRQQHQTTAIAADKPQYHVKFKKNLTRAQACKREKANHSKTPS